MTNFLKYVNWLLTRKKIEQDLLNYCRLEFRDDEVDFAYKQAIKNHKSYVFGNV